MMGQVLMWLKGAILHRLGHLTGSVIGVALTVAFVAVLGVFLAVSNAEMTRRAISDVPVDWQVQLAPGADINAVRSQIEQTVKPQVIEEVFYANVDGFTARTGSSVQTTGAGQVLGISLRYFNHFPKEVRPLLGATQGVLIAQQTSANLHVTVGDSVQVLRIGLPPVTVTIEGIIDLPNADSLFQAVGVPAGTAPQAPPDNVLILPDTLWQTYFRPQQAVRPDSIRTQFHLRLGHPLPGNPTAAYTMVTRQANNLEARIAGSGIVGNNLASRLLGVTEDALYAEVLFLFLGLPGVILVISLTLAIAGSAGTRRASEQALLRVRGATLGQIMRLVTAEAILVGVGGILLGLALALAFSRYLHMPLRQLWDPHARVWIILAALVGLLLALGAVIVPAWLLARQTTVAAARAVVRPVHTPLWQRTGLDIIILLIGVVEYWRTASTGYQVVLAPEGVAANAVNYEAFIAPLCLWIGGILLAYRLISWALRNGRALLARVLAPLVHTLSILVAGSISRQQGLITRGIVLVALALSFAISTAIFNTTYNRQSLIDAELTNGSDVTVTGTTASPPGNKLDALRAIPGVAAVQPMQHRFAYVGNDLQDIYGIDPHHIAEATSISDAFFGNHNARATLDALANTPDGVLVSQETVNDFQLQPGDSINLRLQSVIDHKYHQVPFHFLGVVREFPTAPSDSFLVANSAYITRVTGSDATEIVLMRVKGDPAVVATRARAVVADIPGARVTDLGSVRRAISSSLTALDLQGLTRLELAFAILLVAGATGLILALGLAVRRRMFAILTGLGAQAAQLGAFLWSEAMLMLVVGVLIGGLLGVGIAQVLVKLLTGVFDPPPETLAVPWGYLALLTAAAIISTVAAVIGISLFSRRHVLEALRGL